MSATPGCAVKVSAYLQQYAWREQFDGGRGIGKSTCIHPVRTDSPFFGSSDHTTASSIPVGHQHHSLLTYVKEERLWKALQQERRVVEHDSDPSGDAVLGAVFPSFSFCNLPRRLRLSNQETDWRRRNVFIDAHCLIEQSSLTKPQSDGNHLTSQIYPKKLQSHLGFGCWWVSNWDRR